MKEITRDKCTLYDDERINPSIRPIILDDIPNSRATKL